MPDSETETFLRDKFPGRSNIEIEELIELFRKGEIIISEKEEYRRHDRSSDTIKIEQINFEKELHHLRLSLRELELREEYIRERYAKANSLQYIIVLIGFAAVAGTLADPIYTNIFSKIAEYWGTTFGSFSPAFVGIAHAQDVSSNVNNYIGSKEIIRYIVHFVLALGFFVSFAIFYFHKDAKTRSNSFDIVKMLTGFFIGVASS